MSIIPHWRTLLHFGYGSVLLLRVPALAAQEPPSAAGTLRQLVCRGKPDIDLRVERDTSPRDGRLLTMVLHYDRGEGKAGEDYRQLQPGACTWNPYGWDGVPPEPGAVYFDVPREAQAWSASGTRQLDTTVSAAVFFPDPVSLPRYLGLTDSFWVFFVDDGSGLSISFGAFKSLLGTPTYTDYTGPWTKSTERTVVASTDPIAHKRPPGKDAATSDASRSTTYDPSRPVWQAGSTSRDGPSPLDTGRIGKAHTSQSRVLAPGIRNVSTTPGPGGVLLRFTVDMNAAVYPIVEFAGYPPRWDDREGRWVFKDGSVGAVVDPRAIGKNYSAQPWFPFTSGKLGYYLITVGREGSSGQLRQRTGSFNAREEE